MLKEETDSVFGHRTMKISHPVRSALNKHRIVRLVLQWVTMWESRMLNSLVILFLLMMCINKSGSERDGFMYRMEYILGLGTLLVADIFLEFPA